MYWLNGYAYVPRYGGEPFWFFAARAFDADWGEAWASGPGYVLGTLWEMLVLWQQMLWPFFLPDSTGTYAAAWTFGVPWRPWPPTEEVPA